MISTTSLLVFVYSCRLLKLFECDSPANISHTESRSYGEAPSTTDKTFYLGDHSTQQNKKQNRIPETIYLFDKLTKKRAREGVLCQQEGIRPQFPDFWPFVLKHYKASTYKADRSFYILQKRCFDDIKASRLMIK